jgi:hypothetical protein
VEVPLKTMGEDIWMIENESSYGLRKMHALQLELF